MQYGIGIIQNGWQEAELRPFSGWVGVPRGSHPEHEVFPPSGLPPESLFGNEANNDGTAPHAEAKSAGKASLTSAKTRPIWAIYFCVPLMFRSSEASLGKSRHDPGWYSENAYNRSDGW